MGIYIYIATQHLAENLKRELYSMVLQTMSFMLLVEEQIVFPHQVRVILQQGVSLKKGQYGCRTRVGQLDVLEMLAASEMC